MFMNEFDNFNASSSSMLLPEFSASPIEDGATMSGACLFKNSRERRDQLKKEIDNLAVQMPIRFEKMSQLRILKAACSLLKKQKKFANYNQKLMHELSQAYRFPVECFNKTLLNELLNGFIVCFSKNGELIYISENVSDYFGLNSIDIILTYDYVHEITSVHDREYYARLKANYTNYLYPNCLTSYTSWFVSKIKRKNTLKFDYKQFKMTSHYDLNTEMFIAVCKPVLTSANRDALLETDSTCFSTVHRLNLKLIEYNRNCENFLGHGRMRNMLDRKTLYEMIAPECMEVVAKRHRELLNGKNTKGTVDLVKLITSDNGHVINCLLNMYYDSKNYFICVYQYIKEEDVQKYLDYIVEDNKATAASMAYSSPEMLTNSNLEFDYVIDSVEESVEDADEWQKRKGLKRTREEAEDNESDFEQKKFKPIQNDDFDYADLNGIDLTELLPLDETKIEEIVNYLKVDLQQSEQTNPNLDCEDLDLENFAPFLEDFLFETDSQHSQSVDTLIPIPKSGSNFIGHQTPNNSPYYYTNTEYYNSPFNAASQSPMNVYISV